MDAFNVDPIYLRHTNEGKVPDYRVRTFPSLDSAIWIIHRYGNRQLLPLCSDNIDLMIVRLNKFSYLTQSKFLMLLTIS